MFVVAALKWFCGQSCADRAIRSYDPFHLLLLRFFAAFLFLFVFLWSCSSMCLLLQECLSQGCPQQPSGGRRGSTTCSRARKRNETTPKRERESEKRISMTALKSWTISKIWSGKRSKWRRTNKLETRLPRKKVLGNLRAQKDLINDLLADPELPRSPSRSQGTTRSCREATEGPGWSSC